MIVAIGHSSPKITKEARELLPDCKLKTYSLSKVLGKYMFVTVPALPSFSKFRVSNPLLKWTKSGNIVLGEIE